MSLEGASRDLRARAQRAGLGGLDHHLGRFEQVLGQRFDRTALRNALQNVSELMWQVRQELASSAPSEPREVNAESHIRASAPPARGNVQPGGGDAVTPPPFLTVHPDGGAAARPPSPPLPLQAAPAPSPPLVISSRRPPAAPAVSFAPTAFDPSRPVPPPPISARVPQAPVLPSPPTHTPSPVLDRAPTPAQNPGRDLPSPPAPGAREAPPSVAPPPKLQVRTMFGLRAFGRAPQPDDPSGPRASLPDEGSLLGLRRKAPTGSSSASLPRGGRSHVPPPMLSGQLPSLPPARARRGARTLSSTPSSNRMGKGKRHRTTPARAEPCKRRLPVQPKAAREVPLSGGSSRRAGSSSAACSWRGSSRGAECGNRSTLHLAGRGRPRRSHRPRRRVPPRARGGRHASDSRPTTSGSRRSSRKFTGTGEKSRPSCEPWSTIRRPCNRRYPGGRALPGRTRALRKARKGARNTDWTGAQNFEATASYREIILARNG